MKNMTIDHVIAKCNGGSNVLNNLRPACKKCNALKGKDSIETFRLRFFWDTLKPSELMTYDKMVTAIAKKKFYCEL